MPLILQLGAAAALGLALARPAIDLGDERRVGLVLDANVSMQALDVSPSRFEAARQQLLSVVESATSSDRFDVVLGSEAPRVVLADASQSAARDVLLQLQSANSASDLETAVDLAAGPNATEVIVATDGARQLDMQPRRTPVSFRLVGGQPDQVALSDVSVRQPVDASQFLAGFASVANYSGVLQATQVEIIADGVLVDSQPISVGPGARTDVTFSVPLTTHSLRVSLPDVDNVPFDKHVDLSAPARFARNLLVVSDHPDLWQRLLASKPFLTLVPTAPAEYQPPGGDELVLFDGWLPTTLPDTERILVDPPGMLTRASTGTRTRGVQTFDRADPLLLGVDLAGLTITDSGATQAPEWSSVSVGSPDDFALGHGLLEGRRTVIFGFDPTASNLPQMAAFPVLVSNAIDWLRSDSGSGEMVHAGLGAAVDVTPHPLQSLPASAGLAPVRRQTAVEGWPFLEALGVVLLTIEGFVALRRGLLGRGPLAATCAAVAAVIVAVVALAQPTLALPQHASNVVVAADRASQASPDAWLKELADQSRQGVDHLSTVEANNLARAVRLGGAAARGASPSRVVVLSDGQTPSLDLDQAVRSLNGIPVDVVPLNAPPPSPTLVLESLDLPPYVRAGENFEATLTIGATDAANTTVSVAIDDRPAKQQQLQVVPGENHLTISAGLDAVGFHRVTVLTPASRIDGFLVVKPPVHVMLVEERPGESSGVMAALRRMPGRFDVVAPGAVSNLASIEPYDAIVLANVSATSFSLDQQRTLQSFVRDRGRGLVVLGGSTSYVLGDYEGSVLEQTLPVTSAIPPRREGARLALLLVIDVSQSMDRVVDGVSGIEMAKQGAILAARSLRDDDQVGVLIFNHKFSWLQPINVVSAIGRQALEDRIGSLTAAGGTEIYAALNEGATAMKAVNSDLRHIVLFTDGNSRDANYDVLTADLVQQHIGLSTVGLGPEADTQLLAKLAKAGQGRFYFSDRPGELPRILATEVAIAKRSAVVEGAIQPQLGTPSALLRGIAPDELPALTGYIATTARPSASVVLATDDQQPLLAQWQVGLGRSVAWTSDVGLTWTAKWPDWANNPRLWQQAIDWAAGQPVQPDFLVSVSASGTSAHIALDALSNDRFIDLASVTATIVGPAGGQSSVSLRQSGPGHYEASIIVDAPGAYMVTVTDGSRSETGGFVIQAHPRQNVFGADEQTLRRIASDTGGRVLSSAAQAFRDRESNLTTVQEPLAPWLVVFALVLFVGGLALRRFGWFFTPAFSAWTASAAAARRRRSAPLPGRR